MDKEKQKIRICFAASSGGHFEQLMMLRPLMEQYDSFVVTEKTVYAADVKGIETYYMVQVNREEKSCFWKLLMNTVKSLKLYEVKHVQDFRENNYLLFPTNWHITHALEHNEGLKLDEYGDQKED